MDIELCKKEFFLLDEELESFKDFLNDPTKNIYHSIDGVKIVKSENGELCSKKLLYFRITPNFEFNIKPLGEIYSHILIQPCPSSVFRASSHFYN